MNIIPRPLHPSRIPKGAHIKAFYKKSGIVLHWPVSTATSVDSSFQNSGVTAYHYVIGADGAIRQYADDNSMIYHAGNWSANQSTISISLEGGYLKDGERVKPSQKAHDACAELVQMLAEKHKFVISRKTVQKHSEVRDAPTMCSGSTDIDYIVDKANKDNKKNMNISLYLSEAEWEGGMYEGKEFIIRLHQNANIIARLPRSQEFIHSNHKDTWGVVKFQKSYEKTLEWHARNKSVEDSKRAFIIDYKEWDKKNPPKAPISKDAKKVFDKIKKLSDHIIKDANTINNSI